MEHRIQFRETSKHHNSNAQVNIIEYALYPYVQSEMLSSWVLVSHIFLHSTLLWNNPIGEKVRLVKAMVFPVVMYGCESWTVKKAEYQRIDAFELWCWRRLLRVPWTVRRSNQSILKISAGISLEGMMLKLKL